MTSISHHQPRRPHFLKRGQITFYVSVLVAVLQGVARGSALELYETGAPDLGTASAGRAAMAADASTAAANPAGMTLHDRSQLMYASGALLPSTN
jgi:long-subunit fatty acid transport protein